MLGMLDIYPWEKSFPPENPGRFCCYGGHFRKKKAMILAALYDVRWVLLWVEFVVHSHCPQRKTGAMSIHVPKNEGKVIPKTNKTKAPGVPRLSGTHIKSLSSQFDPNIAGDDLEESFIPDCGVEIIPRSRRPLKEYGDDSFESEENALPKKDTVVKQLPSQSAIHRTLTKNDTTNKENVGNDGEKEKKTPFLERQTGAKHDLLSKGRQFLLEQQKRRKLEATKPPIKDVAWKELLSRLKECNNNEERLAILEKENPTCLFSSAQLDHMIDKKDQDNVKARLGIVLLIAPRLTDPQTKASQFICLFRNGVDKERVAAAFTARTQLVTANAPLLRRMVEYEKMTKAVKLKELNDEALELANKPLPPGLSHHVMPPSTRPVRTNEIYVNPDDDDEDDEDNEHNHNNNHQGHTQPRSNVSSPTDNRSTPSVGVPSSSSKTRITSPVGRKSSPKTAVISTPKQSTIGTGIGSSHTSRTINQTSPVLLSTVDPEDGLGPIGQEMLLDGTDDHDETTGGAIDDTGENSQSVGMADLPHDVMEQVGDGEEGMIGERMRGDGGEGGEGLIAGSRGGVDIMPGGVQGGVQGEGLPNPSTSSRRERIEHIHERIRTSVSSRLHASLGTPIHTILPRNNKRPSLCFFAYDPLIDDPFAP